MLVVTIDSQYVAVQSNTFCTQDNNCESKTSFILRIHERHPHLALTGELWVSFVSYLEKSDRDISGAHCIGRECIVWCYTYRTLVHIMICRLKTQRHFQYSHDDVIKWKHFPRNWPFVRGIHRSRWIPHKGQWRGALMFSLTCVWTYMINDWVNNREAGDLRCHRAHYDVIVMTHRYASCHFRERKYYKNCSWRQIPEMIAKYAIEVTGTSPRDQWVKINPLNNYRCAWITLQNSIGMELL